MSFAGSHVGLGDRKAGRQWHSRRTWTSISQVGWERESERRNEVGIGPYRVFKTDGGSELEYSWSWSVKNHRKTKYVWWLEKEDSPSRPDEQDLLILSIRVVETGYRAGTCGNKGKYEDEDEDENEIYTIQREAWQYIGCGQLVTEVEGVAVLSTLCSGIDVPVKDIPGDILYEIISFGRRVSARRGSGRCVPPTIPRICFTLGVRTWLKEEDAILSMFKSTWKEDRQDRALLNPNPNPNPVGASASASASAGEKVIYMQRCSICLDDFPHGSILARLPCGHVFHQHCVRPSHHSSCPLCVSSLVLSTLPAYILAPFP